MDLLAELAASTGVALVLVTHVLGVVRRLGGDVVVLGDGEVRESGPVRAVLSAPTSSYTAALVSAEAEPSAPGVS